MKDVKYEIVTLTFKFTDDYVIRVHIKYCIRFIIHVMKENCFRNLDNT